MKKALILCAIVLFLGMAVNASAIELLINGDFETGDLTGWTTSGQVEVVNPATPSLPDYIADFQGMDDNFALLGYGTTSGDSVLSQSFSVSGASSITLSFNFAFDYFDLSRKTDTFLALTTYTGDIAGIITMEEIGSFLIGADYGFYTKTFTLLPEWTLDTNMSFTLSEASTRWTNSIVGIDNVSANTVAAVPEPGTLFLLGTGFLGLVGLGYRRKKGKV